MYATAKNYEIIHADTIYCTHLCHGFPSQKVKQSQTYYNEGNDEQ